MIASVTGLTHTSTMIRVFVLAIALAAPATTQAQSQYPTRPIRLIVPYPPGAGTDFTAREIAAQFSKALGQPVVVDNRPGAAATLGHALAAKAPPDGYTLLLGTTGGLVSGPALLGTKIAYDPLKDFTTIGLATYVPYSLVLTASLPVTNVKELVALAKKQPGKLHFGSGGVGVGLHMAGELFSQVAGIKLVHVPYKGAAPAMTAVIGGEIDMMFNGIPPTLPHIKAGRVRVLAIGSDDRTDLLPAVPTILESGIPFSTEGWYGIVAPKGTPQPIIDTLHKTLTQVMTSAEVKATMAKLAVDTSATSPAQFGKFIRSENERWGRVIKKAGISMK